GSPASAARFLGERARGGLQLRADRGAAAERADRPARDTSARERARHQPLLHTGRDARDERARFPERPRLGGARLQDAGGAGTGSGGAAGAARSVAGAGAEAAGGTARATGSVG